jgi:hypothetical protein
MSKPKMFSELRVEPGQIDGLTKIVASSGDVVIAGTFQFEADAQRLVDCWNACRKLHNPANHISETDAYVERLEGLRKDAWKRAVELGANDFLPIMEVTE